MNRRHFIKNISAGSLILASPNIPFQLLHDPEISRITILHTNDVHSRIEPFPMDGSRNEGMGGAARRAALIDQVRKEVDHVLLLDAGDIFQGTPYFNFFGGELEMKLMTEMGYDAATIGNHDFDAGIDGLEKQLVHAEFPLLNVNYDFSDTIMAGKTKDYIIRNLGGIKVGITGVGIELNGLVPQSLYKNTQYLAPLAKVQESVNRMKYDEHCDYIICLSHLGYRYRDDKVSDVVLAENTTDLDLIIGGHTHTFMSEPELYHNKKGEKVVINQVGWGGIMLGRLDVTFEKNEKGKCVYCSNTFIK